MEESLDTARSRDWILGTVFALTSLGLVMVYSAAGGRTANMATADRALAAHGAHILIGLALLAVMSRIDYHWLGWLSIPLLALGGVLLVVVLFCPAIKGSHRWIVVTRTMRFQPSELMKLSMVLFVAHYMSKVGDEAGSFKRGFMHPTLVVGLLCGLIFIEKDLGTSALIATVAFIMMLAGGTRVMYVAMLACVSLPLMFGMVRHSPYQWARITAFLHPYADPDGTGYHAIQSLISLGSGGWFGLGLGCGRHKLLFVPETKADSVFCVVGEELGFVGTALVVAAYMLWAREGIKVALNAPDRFGSLLAFGITMMIGLQAAINIAVVTVTVPTKGLPLPLVSAGGSSIVLALTSVGVLLNVARQCTAQTPTPQTTTFESNTAPHAYVHSKPAPAA